MTRVCLILVLVVGAALILGHSTTQAQKMDVIAAGEIEFQNYCAVCHGVDGRGYGIMRRYLQVPPADLTRLGNGEPGKFPFWEVYEKIDGAREVRGHGNREMPVWGDRFRAEAGDNSKSSQAQAAGRILSIVFYLQHIQK